MQVLSWRRPPARRADTVKTRMGPEAAKTLQQVARLADCTSQYEFMSLRRRALRQRPPLPTTWMPVHCLIRATASRLCLLTSCLSAGRQVKRDFMVFSLAAQNRTAPKRVGKRARPTPLRWLVRAVG